MFPQSRETFINKRDQLSIGAKNEGWRERRSAKKVKNKATEVTGLYSENSQQKIDILGPILSLFRFLCHVHLHGIQMSSIMQR